MLSHRTFNITLRISFNITLIVVFSQVNYFTQYPVKGVYGNLFNNNTIYIYIPCPYCDGCIRVLSLSKVLHKMC